MRHQPHAHGPAQHGRLLGDVPEADEAHALATEAVHGETWGKGEASLEICGSINKAREIPYIYIYVYIYICMCIYIYVYMYILYIYTYVCIYIYI